MFFQLQKKLNFETKKLTLKHKNPKKEKIFKKIGSRKKNKKKIFSTHPKKSKEKKTHTTHSKKNR